MKNNSLDQNKTPSSKKEKKKYKTYSYALKREVVYQVTSGKMFINQARKHYNIHGKTLIYNWIEKYGLLFYNPNKSYAMQESPNDTIKQLRKEVEELKFQKEIFLDMHQVLIEDYGVDVKKCLPGQLVKELEKHMVKNPKKV
jgi:transposase-like protein